MANDWIFCMFQVYAECLAQAIYVAFIGAFPQSQEHFDDNFTTELAEVTSLWVSGKCLFSCRKAPSCTAAEAERKGKGST